MGRVYGAGSFPQRTSGGGPPPHGPSPDLLLLATAGVDKLLLATASANRLKLNN